MIGRIVRAERERKEQQPRHVAQCGNGGQADREPVLGQENRRYVARAEEAVEHVRAETQVRHGEREPAPDEHGELAARRHGPHAQQPRRGHQPRRYRPILLAQHAGGHRRGAPQHTTALERGVDGQQGEHGGHQLVPAHDVRHSLDVHRVDSEQGARHKGRRAARPAAGEHRDQHARPAVPRQVHRVEPGRGAHEPIERVRRDRDRAVGRGVEIGREVGGSEGAPHSRWSMDEGVEGQDGTIVEGEAVPEGAEIHDDGAGAHGEVEALPGHHGVSGA